MQNKLTEIEEGELRKHFQLKVRPQYKTKTLDKIVDAVNKVRTGIMKESEWVNSSTKIITWGDYFENWNLMGRFINFE